MSNRIKAWLEALGLVEYEKLFATQRIDYEVLPELTDADLKDLGIPLGPRKKLLKAISKLTPDTASTETHEATVVSTPDAERRQLTVMFCDLVGSTELSQILDPEDMREVNRAYQDACKNAIERYEGYVARYMGDGVLAYFGYPQAHEDDAERAVHAGLGVVAAMADLTETVDHMQVEEVRVRVGIATGPVVVGDIVGAGASQENAVVGETPNLAARLQSMAVPNSVWVDETTQRLADGRFDWSVLGELSLKGFQAHVPAFQAIREREVASRYESRGVDHYRLVGRQSELALLNDRWLLAAGGEGQVIGLSGEPGIGKSRLLQNFLEQIPREQYTRVQYQCSPHHLNSPLFPVLRQVERAAGFGGSDSGAQRLDKLERFLNLAETESKDGASLVGALLNLPVDDRYGPLDITPQQRKAKTLAVLSQNIVLSSATLPIVVVFEDAHWIDPTTEEYLQQIISIVENIPILVLITHRQEYEADWSSWYGYCTTLSLNRLGKLHTRDLANAVSAGHLSPDLMEHVVARTDGIPLFIEELTSSILESREANTAIEDIPITLQASLDARLDRLGTAKEVAQVGSILGREFSYRLLAEVAGKSDDHLEDLCRRLVAAGLASQHGSHEDTTYVFKHALVQEAAYNTLLKPRRRELHTRAAKAIEKLWPQILESNPEVVAEHFSQGGELKRATELWLVAGRLSAQRTAYKEAITHLTRVLNTAAKQPQSKEWLSHELAAWVVLGPVLMATEGPASPGPKKAYRKAREISAALNNGEQHFRATYGIWQLTNVGGQHTEAREIAEELIAASETDGDDHHTLQAHHATWSTTFSQGDFDTCRSHLAIDRKSVV
jgi:class 3 adenylate cyclase